MAYYEPILRKVESPAYTIYIGGAREIISLKRNLYKRNLAHDYPWKGDYEITEKDMKEDKIYGLSVSKADEIFDHLEGCTCILPETDVIFALMGEIDELKAKLKAKEAS